MNVLLAIWSFLYDLLLGCRHENVSRPFTLQRQTYKVCLECGSRIYYSAETMRPLSAREARRAQAIEAGELLVVPPVTGNLNCPEGTKAVA